ncbi:DUF2993 domain-containing protein [Synechococcus sp. Cu2B8-bc1011]|uniref:LmeA family phospholipid-binding protein n=1 Tax=Synechococcus sp. Cu2B8-bc1011 TaxID=3093725 RepID=UPI0039B10916
MLSMNANSSGPLLQLLSNGLQIWIRGQCDEVGELKLNLQGSALQLLRGKLEGVSLTARKVSFQKLPLLRAELKTSSLQAHINPSHPGQPIQLSHSFNIDGEVVFNGADLNRALASDRWSWLGDLLSEQLMGLTPLRSLSIDDDLLELQAAVIATQDPVRARFGLKASEGTIQITHLETGKSLLLPMDPGIHIQKAHLKAGQLILEGTATVSP